MSSEPHALTRRTAIGGGAALGVGLPLLGAGPGVAAAAPPDGSPNGA